MVTKPGRNVQGDDLAAFLTNVSVGEGSRGQGIGKALLEEAIEKAKSSWGTARIFAFVDSDNEVGNMACAPHRERGSINDFHEFIWPLGPTWDKTMLLSAAAGWWLPGTRKVSPGVYGRREIALAAIIQICMHHPHVQEEWTLKCFISDVAQCPTSVDPTANCMHIRWQI